VTLAKKLAKNLGLNKAIKEFFAEDVTYMLMVIPHYQD
jgi:hypothetical protein